MAFFFIEDEFGLLDTAISPDVYERVREVFLESCFLEARGNIRKDVNSYSLWLLDSRPLWKEEKARELFIEPELYFHLRTTLPGRQRGA